MGGGKGIQKEIERRVKETRRGGETVLERAKREGKATEVAKNQRRIAAGKGDKGEETINAEEY